MTASLRIPALRGAPLLAVALALAACKAPEQVQMPPPEVGVVVVQPQSVPLQRDLAGRLAPFRSSDVRARVAGVLQKRVYQEGSDVKEGQLLFLIDPAPLQATLGSAQAGLASAQAEYANAHASANRARQLAPQKFVSKSDLDNAEAAERSAAAAVQQAKANVATARINLGYASVTAPISGRAGKQQVTEGALVGNGDATLLTTIDQVDPLYVNFSVGASELERLRNASNVSLAGKGQATVSVVLGDGSVYPQPGTVDFADTVVDPSTGAVSLRARVANAEHTLMPGSFVTLRATLGEQLGAFLVPQAAIQRDATSAYAMVVGQDGTVARKDVAISEAGNGQWLVSSGLAAGDQVIVSGLQAIGMAQQMSGGKPVKVKATPWKPEAAPAGAPAAAATQH